MRRSARRYIPALLAAGIAGVSMSGPAQGNALKNPGFESWAEGSPQGWEQSGEGEVARAKGRTNGGKAVRLSGGKEYHLLFQWIGPARAGKEYRAKVWAKADTVPGGAELKLEFLMLSGEKVQYGYAFSPGKEWTEYSFSNSAPEGAIGAAITLVAHRGAHVLFDDASLKEFSEKADSNIVFDLNDPGERIQGFGVHHWAGQKEAAEEFAGLNIKYVRLTKDWDSWSDLRAFHRKTEKLRIKWIYVRWAVPEEFLGPDKKLKDVEGYASDWLAFVRKLNSQSCRPHYIDLLNEPDYFGIPPKAYNELVKRVRDKLDHAGYPDVRIVGPGLTHVGMNNFRKYLSALDRRAVASLYAWATHAWEDAWEDGSGSVRITDARAKEFVRACREADPGKPIWYTEYATRQTRFHGIKYPHPDFESDNYCASFTMPYAMRVYENTLAILNHGANAVFYWSSQDYRDSKKQWGYIGPDGEKKPVYFALKSLYGNIPPETRVLRPPPDIGEKSLYAGAFLDDISRANPRVIVGLVNTSEKKRKASVRLANAPGSLKLVRAEECRLKKRGNPGKKRADEARLAPGKVRLQRRAGAWEFDVALRPDSSLTVILESAGR